MPIFFNNVDFRGNEALNIVINTIDDGDYAGTAKTGMIVYFKELTGSPASTDFLEGPGMYEYDGTTWSRQAKYSEITTPTSAVNIRGDVAPSAANFPYPKDSAAMMTGAIQTGNGSLPGPQIGKGDLWYITPGTLSLPTVIGPAPGVTVDDGYSLIAKVDNASNAHTDWLVLPGSSSSTSVSSATETVEGIAEIATQVETDTGTDDTRIVTPLKLKTNLTSNNLASYYEESISGTSGTAIFSNVDTITDILNIVILNADRVPDSTINIGVPSIVSSELNIPWTSSSSLSGYLMVLTAKIS